MDSGTSLVVIAYQLFFADESAASAVAETKQAVKYAARSESSWKFFDSYKIVQFTSYIPYMGVCSNGTFKSVM